MNQLTFAARQDKYRQKDIGRSLTFAKIESLLVAAAVSQKLQCTAAGGPAGNGRLPGSA